MKIPVKSISCLLLIFLSASVFGQEEWTFGVGYGKSQNFNGVTGDEMYFNGTYRLNNTWAISSRLSYLQTESFFDSKTFTFQPEINWIIVKKPFIFYPSFGVAIGREWYPNINESQIYQEGLVWGPNVGLNLDIPIGRFSVGTRFSGNTLIQGNQGNSFFSLSGVIKFRLGKNK